jgi:protein gp37
MSQDTNIEWADSTLNLQMGCDGCELWNNKTKEGTCYAAQLTERYAGSSKGYPESFSKPKLFISRLAQALRWKDLTGTKRESKPWLNDLPRLIFLDDMGDTFTESLDLEWLAMPFAVCRRGHEVPTVQFLAHENAYSCTECRTVFPKRTVLEVLGGMKAIIMLLTKRASRMRKFFAQHPCPDNFMLMTSVTTAKNMNRVQELVKIPCRYRAVSYEPALGPVDFMPYLGAEPDDPFEPKLDLIIFGGESGHGKRAVNLAWGRTTRDRCGKMGTRFFMKQVDKVQAIPEDLNIQQMPLLTLEALDSREVCR